MSSIPMNFEIGFHEALKKRLDELRAAKLAQLGVGTWKTLEAAREMVGYLKGLTDVEAEAEALRKKLTEM